MDERNEKSGVAEVAPTKSGSYATSVTVKETGKTFPLKGYGAVQGQLSIKKGIDLGKPVSTQVAKSRAASTLTQGRTSKKK